ncbi:MAG: PAS domain-containing protein, partial [Chloroflexota bacterium]|nr:PAS domain-containing protein [Chloroflexota bacterium]
LVVVGSSAGGIEALGTLVAGLPADFPAPIVIAQHLDPNHQSHLAEILGRKSPLPVRTVDDTEALEHGVIFVVPSNRHVEITDHHVGVLANGPERPKPSVDRLLITAAAVFGERLIAVILTGSGSDGTAGARAVKEADGMVIIQDPDTAAYPSMPRSLAPTTVDIAASLEQIGPILADIVSGQSAPPDPTTDDTLRDILDGVHTRRGIDFSTYKQQTIMRRLRRRVTAVGVSTFDDYRAYMAEHPEEEQRLVSSFLINVTRFFRDATLFDHLREQVLPKLITSAREGGHELRLWSAGCATGEEAYSLAILIADLLGNEREAMDVRIFATDLDEDALAFARRGTYPAAALENVPSELVERHFIRQDGDYQVNKGVRSMVLFGHHDLGQRPSFPNIDMVLCRNVLIYFAQELQLRAIQLFAHALNDGGYLVLGKSETPRPMADSFTQVDRTFRVFRRDGPRPRLPIAQIPARRGNASSGDVQHVRPASNRNDLAGHAQSTADGFYQPNHRLEHRLRALPFGLVVIDRRYDIQAINNAARSWLGIHSIALGEDFIHLAEGVSSSSLRSAINAVIHGDGPVHLDAETIDTTTGDPRHLALTCYPDSMNDEGIVETVVISIVDITTVINDRQDRGEDLGRLQDENIRLKESTARLGDANRHLLRANQELTDAVEDLDEQTDTLRVANESLQVGTEEIETLNEELQSTNEELETLNEETQATVEELNAANDDLETKTVALRELAERHATGQSHLSAILANMGDAVLVVARDGSVVRTNLAYDELLRGEDSEFAPLDEQGNPLSPASTPQHRAARGETFRQVFTMAGGGDDARRWFEANGRPVSTDGIEGGVLVMRDITDRSLRLLQNEFIAMASHELRTPMTAISGYLQLASRQVSSGGDPERLQRHLIG